MEQPNGGLKDIFSTILGETSGQPTNRSQPPPRIVVHGDGNVIAPGGTVHYVQAASPARQAAPRRREG